MSPVSMSPEAEVEKKIGQIDCQLTSLDATVSRLSDKTQVLIDRLSSILIPATKQPPPPEEALIILIVLLILL